MHVFVDRWAAGEVVSEDSLAADFESRLSESAALAFRVAYGVVRNRQDAEDVAQEAFVRAYRRFGSLRDRDRFRAWLVRLTAQGGSQTPPSRAVSRNVSRKP